MLNVEKMIKSAEQALGWPYKSPGTNDSNGIDCSGLFVKIFKDQGASIYHGSNTIYHQYCTETGKLTSVSQLLPGMAVFKLKEWTDKDSGNRWYGKSPGNLSHIGLVVSVSPFKIIHASSIGCVTTDNSISKWACYGKLKNVDYSEGNKESDTMTATVYSENGNPVKMRAKPSTSSNSYREIPCGEVVVILEKGETWSKISFAGYTGYMMSKFLITNEIGEPASNEKIMVNRADLERAYDILGDLLGFRG